MLNQFLVAPNRAGLLFYLDQQFLLLVRVMMKQMIGNFLVTYVRIQVSASSNMIRYDFILFLGQIKTYPMR